MQDAPNQFSEYILSNIRCPHCDVSLSIKQSSLIRDHELLSTRCRSCDKPIWFRQTGEKIELADQIPPLRPLQDAPQWRIDHGSPAILFSADPQSALRLLAQFPRGTKMTVTNA